MKKGFTLIELLGVIILIAVIAVITTPVVNNVIKDTKEKAFKNSVQELVNITKMDYNEYARVGKITYTYENDKLICKACAVNGEDTSLDYTGSLDASGEIINDGKVITLSISNEDYSAVYKNKKVEVIKKQ